MVQKRKNPILLDWFSVTYRSVGWTVLLAGVLGAVGWFAWARYGDNPRLGAEEAIRRAAALLSRAESLEGPDRLEEICHNARAALGEARMQLADRSYETARIAAIRAENLAQQAINIAAGEGAPAEMVRFYRLEGDVRVKRTGEFAWEPADIGMRLAEGDQVKTSSKASARLIYFDGTVTTIQPGSLVEIRDLHEDPVTRVRRVSEKLNWGELTASTSKRNVEGSYHEVATDKVSARAEDEGEFRIAFDKEKRTASFDVFNGRIEVASAGRKESVVAGERIRSSRNGKLSAKEILPGVPRLITPSDEKVFVHEDPSKIRTTLSWEPVAGAARYHLEISDGVLFTDLLYDAERKDTSVAIDGVAAGDYYWRVSAIAPSGLEGPYSPHRHFTVSSQVIRDRDDTVPPNLLITEFVPVGSMLIINGNTEPGATLWIDNEKVDVSEDGSFYSVVKLRREGANEVRFVAQDNSGNETTLTRSAYTESF